MRCWEVVAARLEKEGWRWGCSEALTADEITVFIVDAHYGDERRYIAISDDKLSAFLELERTLQKAGPQFPGTKSPTD
jgi:hypothetical protein